MQKKTWFMILLFALCGQINAMQNDLVICLDVSGSMRFPYLPAGAGGAGTCNEMLPIGVPAASVGTHHVDSRYAKVHEALTEVFLMLEALELAPGGGVGSVHVVRFPHVAPSPDEETDPFPATCVNPFSTSASVCEVTDYITDDILIDCSSHGTPLAAALQVSNNLLHPLGPCLPGTAGDATGPLNKMVLLISDGQPTDLFNTVDNGVINSQLGLNVCDDVQIHAIGIGNYTALNYFSLLNRIADRRRGRFYGYVPPGGAAGSWSGGTTALPIGDVDLNFLAKTLDFLTDLKSHLAAMFGYGAIADPGTLLDPGQTKEFPFVITRLDTSLIFTLHWEDARRDVDAAIVLPNGQIIPDTSGDFDVGYSVRRGRRSTSFTFFNRFIAQQHGEWRLRLTGPQSEKDATFVIYSVFTRSDLRVNTEFARKSFKTGDFFSGKTSINFQNTRLTNAKVEVGYQAPENWRGNWNSQQKLTSAERRLIQTGIPDANGEIIPWSNELTLIERKFIYLNNLKNRQFFARFESGVNVAPLFDNGDSEDEDDNANDGVYNAKFFKLRTPGLHQVQYRISGETQDGTPFQRELYFHKFVDVNIEPIWENSKVKFKPLAGEGNRQRTRVTVKFQDKFGNLPLPPDSGIVQIDLDERGQKAGTLVNRLDGTYSQDFSYDPALGKPQVFVQYGEGKFPSRPVIFIPEKELVPGTKYLFLDDSLGMTNPVMAVFRYDWYLSTRWVLGMEAAVGPAKDRMDVKGTVLTSSLNLKLNLLTGDTFRPYVFGGASYLRFQGFSTDDQTVAGTLGLGAVIPLTLRLALSLEGADLIANDLYGFHWTHHFYAAIGIAYGLY